MTEVSPARGPRYVLVTDGRAASGRARFAWRLDAANHRPLGRGAGTFDSVDECRRWLSGLRASRDALAPTLSFDVSRGVWSWRVTRSTSVAAVSVRTYPRRFDCHRAIGYFLRAVIDADPDDGVVRLVSAAALDRHATDGPPAARTVTS